MEKKEKFYVVMDQNDFGSEHDTYEAAKAALDQERKKPGKQGTGRIISTEEYDVP